MIKWDEKSNNEILMEIKTMEHKHSTIKDELLRVYTELEKVELNYKKASEVLMNRLKR